MSVNQTSCKASCKASCGALNEQKDVLEFGEIMEALGKYSTCLTNEKYNNLIVAYLKLFPSEASDKDIKNEILALGEIMQTLGKYSEILHNEKYRNVIVAFLNLFSCEASCAASNKTD